MESTNETAPVQDAKPAPETKWYVIRVISGKEILALFRDEHEKKVLDPQTVKAIAALLDQKCRDVGVD